MLWWNWKITINEYILTLIDSHNKVAVLSRGYEEKGFSMVKIHLL